MQTIRDARLSRRTAHSPVESRTPDGKTKISCADPGCAAWDPFPCESRAEAQFWYERHISHVLFGHIRG
jgi:hypothetical protein